ncbi:hypothetical protein BIFPSEUDO_02857 [Bifidobacterium pseudocatenulatum DSM 20438 = JCM 1200 = LMG 10505]|uniref:Uncharacterized protein n=1 Tax=Bifidobacterium pseudocatenulatum DSM 20438 = JCM 1200 = LMG 10505 TaxID=547043 RepID=C0BR50_BIFPS|nr:hypothetical protein BIFPSEUDO_02857 [Bifidobacterium pseudocatenulatum DSM 20438 = JCM 1200 = LMG 10505]
MESTHFFGVRSVKSSADRPYDACAIQYMPAQASISNAQAM